MTSPSITIKNSFIDKINRHDNFMHIYNSCGLLPDGRLGRCRNQLEDDLNDLDDENDSGGRPWRRREIRARWEGGD